jgi:hypothetical protein
LFLSRCLGLLLCLLSFFCLAFWTGAPWKRHRPPLPVLPRLRSGLRHASAFACLLHHRVMWDGRERRVHHAILVWHRSAHVLGPPRRPEGWRYD